MEINMGYPSVTTLHVRGDRWPCTCTCKSAQIYIKLGISLGKLQVNMEVKCKTNKNFVCFIFPWKNSTVGHYMHQCIKTAFKVTVSRDGYFFEGLNILISTFCVCDDAFQGRSKAFHYPLQFMVNVFIEPKYSYKYTDHIVIAFLLFYIVSVICYTYTGYKCTHRTGV